MAEWEWRDVLEYVDREDVPVNAAHNFVYRSSAPIDATIRHRVGAAAPPWTRFDLGKPFWRATPAELAGTPPAPYVYVYKSFGDTHTTVPVPPSESERSGRFVRSANTECGIHTRAAVAGAPHGGELINLMVNDASKRAALLASTTRTIELNERQVCDVELLINGGFSPLTGFMTKEEVRPALDCTGHRKSQCNLREIQ